MTDEKQAWEVFLATGRFTDEFRLLLKERLGRRGYSYRRAALRVGVTIPTLSKWLNGPTVRCGLAGRHRLFSFMQELSAAESLSSSQQNAMVAEPEVAYDYDCEAERFRQCLHRMRAVTEICRFFPELRDRFLQTVRIRNSQVLEHLLGNFS